MSTTRPVKKVVAAVIRRDGHILIGQRRPTASHPLKWEFPGGKVEPGEEPSAALSRELREELGIEATPGPLIEEYEVQYGANPPSWLMFFEVTEFAGEPRNLDFAQIQWERPKRLPEYDFLEGDVAFVKRLAMEQPE